MDYLYVINGSASEDAITSSSRAERYAKRHRQKELSHPIRLVRAVDPSSAVDPSMNCTLPPLVHEIIASFLPIRSLLDLMVTSRWAFDVYASKRTPGVLAIRSHIPQDRQIRALYASVDAKTELAQRVVLGLLRRWKDVICVRLTDWLAVEGFLEWSWYRQDATMCTNLTSLGISARMRWDSRKALNDSVDNVVWALSEGAWPQLKELRVEGWCESMPKLLVAFESRDASGCRPLTALHITEIHQSWQMRTADDIAPLLRGSACCKLEDLKLSGSIIYDYRTYTYTNVILDAAAAALPNLKRLMVAFDGLHEDPLTAARALQSGAWPRLTDLDMQCHETQPSYQALEAAAAMRLVRLGEW